MAPADLSGEARNRDLDVKPLAFLGSGREFKVSKSPLPGAHERLSGMPAGDPGGELPRPAVLGRGRMSQSWACPLALSLLTSRPISTPPNNPGCVPWPMALPGSHCPSDKVRAPRPASQAAGCRTPCPQTSLTIGHARHWDHGDRKGVINL